MGVGHELVQYVTKMIVLDKPKDLAYSLSTVLAENFSDIYQRDWHGDLEYVYRVEIDPEGIVIWCYKRNADEPCDPEDYAEWPSATILTAETIGHHVTDNTRQTGHEIYALTSVSLSNTLPFTPPRELTFAPRARLV